MPHLSMKKDVRNATAVDILCVEAGDCDIILSCLNLQGENQIVSLVQLKEQITGLTAIGKVSGLVPEF